MKPLNFLWIMRGFSPLVALVLLISACSNEKASEEISLNQAVSKNAKTTEINEKIAKFCLKAQDFAGCVQTMTQKEVPFKQKRDSDSGLRTWTRGTGVIVRMRTDSIEAMESKGTYGRYIKWIYSRTTGNQSGGSTWSVEGDCKDYTVNWEGDLAGWTKVRNPKELVKKNRSAYEPAIEAKAVLDEFCPQMNRLIADKTKS